MNEINNPTNAAASPINNLGALRSDISLTLHTHYATRIWMGRPWSTEENGKKQAQIISLPHCLSILNQINQDASNNDPYADLFLIQFEEKIQSARKQMQDISEKIYDLYAKLIPEEVDIQRCHNLSPVTLPIYIKYPMGYILVYLLTDFDAVARAVLTASHIAIMTKADAKAWMQQASHLVRSVFAEAQQYRHSGVTRQDFAENNARALSAIERLGTLPQAVLDGIQRSGYAPVIRNLADADELQLDVELANSEVVDNTKLL
ncbi:hypothetical protein A1D23_12985 [Chelonobacter oris]|uniref:PFL_4669 family integrating conjugative element protein n=1 Tax=Chelonobacter oris TaxID=505317 RepID=UPI00244B51D2|nr:TIGR03761 family integrating conjugative element protein [Chelonobacter oris]MDH3001454.1 hypothetical protein [Chelonobacter oris]